MALQFAVSHTLIHILVHFSYPLFLSTFLSPIAFLFQFSSCRFPLRSVRLYSSLLSSIKRDPSFSQITEEDVGYFRQVLSPAAVVTDKDELQQYNVDWMKKYRGHSRLALKPKTTGQVSAILKYCNDRRCCLHSCGLDPPYRFLTGFPLDS